MSFIRTGHPLSAASWAMPPPIAPAPRTPTRFTGERRDPGRDAGLLLDLLHPEEEVHEALHRRRADEPRDRLDLELQRLRERPAEALLRSPPAPRAAPGSSRASPSSPTRGPCLKTIDRPIPSRSLSIAFAGATRSGPPSGAAFARFFVPNLPRANFLAASRRIGAGTTSSTRPILFARFESTTLPGEDDVERRREADDPRQPRRPAPARGGSRA